MENNKINLNSLFIISIFSLSIFLWSFQPFNIQFRFLYLVLLIKLSYDFFYKKEKINFNLLTWYICFFLVIFLINFKSIIVSPKLIYSNILLFLVIIVVSCYWKYLKNIDYLIGVFIFCFGVSLIATSDFLVPHYGMPHTHNAWIDKCGGVTRNFLSLFFENHPSFYIRDYHYSLHTDGDLLGVTNRSEYKEKLDGNVIGMFQPDQIYADVINHYKITFKEVLFKENSHLTIFAPSIILYSIYKISNNKNFLYKIILILFIFLLYTKSTSIFFIGIITSFIIIYIFNRKKFNKKITIIYFILIFALGYNFSSDIACQKRFSPIKIKIISVANDLKIKFKNTLSKEKITVIKEDKSEFQAAHTGKEKLPSVTTILSATQDPEKAQSVKAWRDRIGEARKAWRDLIGEAAAKEGSFFCSEEQIKEKINASDPKELMILQVACPKKIEGSNLSTSVLIMAFDVTINAIKEKPWGWGLNNYAQAHAYFNNNNQLDLLGDFANHHVIRNLNTSDGSSTVLKLIVELGLFSIIIFTIIFLYLLSNKIPIEEKLFYLPLIFTQFLRGVGYFNGGFFIILIFITLSYFNRKN
jgi:hypothetical protein